MTGGRDRPEGPSELGTLLRRLRERAQLTQEELTERIRLSDGQFGKNTISDIERGRGRSVQHMTARLIATGLRLTVEEADHFEALAAQLRRTGVPSGVRARPGAAPNPGIPPNTALIDRAGDVRAVTKLLRAGARLVTIHGTGGVGKTRVAVAVAAALVGDFADGVHFIALDALRDPALVAPTVARALGIREAAGRSTAERLAAHLRSRNLLLVLDSVEPVAAAAALFGGWVRDAPSLAVLATSRERPHLATGAAHEVAPLEERWAIALFVARARAAQEDFRLSPNATSVVAEICARVDNLPLAIELAAARVPLFTPVALLERLERRLPLLTGGPRDQPARQQTMRATIAWSDELLNADGRRLFRRLAPFVGGATMAAVEAVCVPLPTVDEAPVAAVDTAAALVAQSLATLTKRGGDEPRLGMLQTIREYAFERLADSGEEVAVRDRHAEYFVALAEAATPHLDGPEAVARLADLDREIDNLRAALDWRLARGGAEAAEATGRLVVALRAYWSRRGHLREGRRALERALTAGDALAPQTRAHALLAIGRLARMQYDPAAARAYLTDALARLQALEDEAAADALDELGIVAAIGGASDEAVAEQRFTEGLALARRVGDPARMARALLRLGNMAHARGDRAGAAARFEESLALLRGLDHPRGLGNTLNNTALAALLAGDWPRADALLAEALAVQREAGDADGTAAVLCTTGHAALARDDTARADALLGESLAIFRAIDNALGLARCLEGFAGIAVSAGDLRRAARLFGAAQALLDARGVRVPAVERPNYDRDLARARDALRTDAFAAAYATGRSLSPDQVAAEIRAAGPRRPAR